MTIELTSEMEQIIHEQIATGRYASAADVLRSALRQLRDLTDLESDIFAGIEDEAAGRMTNLDEFDSAFRVAKSMTSVP